MWQVWFNKRHLGKTRNNNPGRVALWTDITAHHQELERIEAIEDFNPKEVTVLEGADKVSVLVNDRIKPVGCNGKIIYDSSCCVKGGRN